jgi:hypothetical protein
MFPILSNNITLTDKGTEQNAPELSLGEWPLPIRNIVGDSNSMKQKRESGESMR